ncbi:MAG: 50S ribosomal protein L3 [Candidatus Hydrothermarchaeota archaeon]|nr:50S ribosomal protein L3 [Candidatus Hydrothermarchaeota archaeon]
MGRRAHHPRRGSLGYSPRKRASRAVPRIRSWPKEVRPRMQGFGGYKAGVTHVIMVDDYRHSLSYGEEVVMVATVIETPPMMVCGVRLYGKDASGLKVLSEAWIKDLNKDLARVLAMPKKAPGKLEDLEGRLEEGEEIRLITHTLPRLTSMSRKKPEIAEYKVSGGMAEAVEYVKGVLGKEMRVNDIFEEGEFVDTISITKGKGFQGPVKRWGVKHLPRKTRKGHRTAGTLGPWHPAAMMWRVPQGGQMGYHQRTEYNKMILKIGDKGEDINPNGGFLGYGLVKGDYMLIKGSIAGTRKRLIRMRPAIRPPKRISEGKPQLSYISLESKQGV